MPSLTPPQRPSIPPAMPSAPSSAPLQTAPHSPHVLPTFPSHLKTSFTEREESSLNTRGASTARPRHYQAQRKVLPVPLAELTTGNPGSAKPQHPSFPESPGEPTGHPGRRTGEVTGGGHSQPRPVAGREPRASTQVTLRHLPTPGRSEPEPSRSRLIKQPARGPGKRLN